MSTQTRKTNNFENDALNSNALKKSFEILNSFETILKMLKMIQMYKVHIF
jgi:hypothetical protein